MSNTAKDLTFYGFNKKDGCRKIGFMVNNLGSSQRNYLMIKNINEFLRTNFAIDISIFVQEITIPCMPVDCAIYHQTQTALFDGHLISSDFPSLINSTKAVQAKHYYYMYDLEWLQRYHGEWSYDDSEFFKAISNGSTVNFTRTPNYVEQIRNAGVPVSNLIVNDFNIDSITRIINDYCK